MFRDYQIMQSIKRAYGISAQEASSRLSEMDALVRAFIGKGGKKEDYLASNIDLAYRKMYEKQKVQPISYKDEDGKKKLKCGSCGKGLRTNDNFCPFCGVDVNSPWEM